MQIFYTCDYCGKRYKTEAECLACEDVHIKEQARQEELKHQKSARTAEIKAKQKELFALIAQYNRDYHEPAEVPYSGALERVLESMIRSIS